MVMTALVHFGPKEAGQAKFEHILLSEPPARSCPSLDCPSDHISLHVQDAVVVQQMVDLPFSRLNEQFKDTQVPGCGSCV